MDGEESFVTTKAHIDRNEQPFSGDVAEDVDIIQCPMDVQDHPTFATLTELSSISVKEMTVITGVQDCQE